MEEMEKEKTIQPAADKTDHESRPDTQENELLCHQEGELFFSYGHDGNQWLVDKLVQDFTERRYHVWIDYNKIYTDADWREEITKGILNSEAVFAFASEHSMRPYGVCRDELNIAANLRGAMIHTILLEKNFEPPAALSKRQFIDMSDWKEMQKQGSEVFQTWYQEKFQTIYACIHSEFVKAYIKEITWLDEMLRPDKTSLKKNRLQAKTYVPRPWLRHEVARFLKEDKRQVMLIDGGPGTGKSAFIASAHLEFPAASCALLFCDWNTSSLSDPFSLIRTLAYQLALAENDYRYLLIQTLQSMQPQELSSSTAPELFHKLITIPLAQSIDGKRDPVVIIVDGLDEAQSDGGTDNPVAALFMAALPHLPKWIRIILTSRPSAYLSMAFADAKIIHLEQNGYSQQDIRNYLEYALGKSRHQARAGYLASLCQDSFLYASLLCKGLLEERFEGNLDALEQNGENDTLQDRLNRLYYQYFRRSFGKADLYFGIEPALAALSVSSEPIPQDLFYAMLSPVNSEQNHLMELLRPYVQISHHSVSFFHKSLDDFLNHRSALGFMITPQHGWKCIADVLSGIYAAKGYEGFDLYGHLHFVQSLRQTQSPLLQEIAEDEEYGEFLLELAMESKESGRTKEAWKLANAALQMVQNNEMDQEILQACWLIGKLSHELVILDGSSRIIRKGVQAAKTIGTSKAYLQAAQLCLLGGYNLFRSKKTARALKAYEQGIVFAQKGNDTALQIEGLRYQAECYCFFGQYENARDSFKRMFAILPLDRIAQKHPDLYPKTAASYGRWLINLRKHQEAMDVFEQALDFQKEREPLTIDQRAMRGMLYYSMSCAAYALRDYPRARQYGEAGLKDLESRHGYFSVELCDTLNQLGWAMRKTNADEEAERLFRRSYEIRLQHYGRESMLSAVSYYNLICTAALRAKEMDEVQRQGLEEMFLDCISLMEEITEESNRFRLVLALLEYTEFLFTCSRTEEAKQMAMRALETAGNNPKRHEALYAYEKLVRIHIHSGEMDHARTIVKSAQYFAREHAHENHPVVQKISAHLHGADTEQPSQAAA